MGFYNVINRTLLQSGQPEDISQVLANFDAIATALNGQIDPQNLRGSPALAAGQAPAWNGSAWVPFVASSIKYNAAWNAGTSYNPGDVVTYQGVTYIAVSASTGVTPPLAVGAQPSYGTTPPTSPGDGSEWIFPADPTNGIMWRFRYNAQSASAYKWEFVGGAPLTVKTIMASVESSSVLGPADTATVHAVSASIPRAGDYFVSYSATHYVTGAGAIAITGLSGAGWAYEGWTWTNVQTQSQVAAQGRVLNLTQGGLLKLQYSLNAAGTNNWANRQSALTPIRVS